MGRDEPTGDEGVTLMEVVVTLGIMSVLMMVFTTGILQVYRTTTATESQVVAQTQLQVAFQRLDKEIRYASWIAVPTRTAPYYVEFAGPPDGTGVVRCGQLRLDGGVLQLLQWTAGSPPAAGQRGQTLASGLVDNNLDGDPAVARHPFVLQLPAESPYATTAPDAQAVGTLFTPEFYRLRVRLTTRLGDRRISSDVTFTALNTSRKTREAPPSPCTEGRPQP